MNYYVGVDIGGTFLKMGIIDENGTIHEYEKVKTSIEKLDLMNQILQFIQKFSSYALKGVGISMPGIITKDGFTQTSGAIKCFYKQNMKIELEKYLGLPVSIENDGKSAALAEKWIGAAQEFDNFVCITLGTAIGGAVFVDGELKRGLGGLAGEFGLAMTSLESHEKENSFAYHAATVGGLCRQYSYCIKERVLDAKEIIHRSLVGDEVASQCLVDFYNAVAILMMNISVMIAPEYILIGGGISEDETVMQSIKDCYKIICQDYHVLSLVEMPKILTCQLKNHAGMIGAVYKFLHK